jgi:flavin-dependent dehydrogenase
LVSMSESFDVIVVGYGLAGAISAIEAHDAGAKFTEGFDTLDLKEAKALLDELAS